MLNHLNLKNFVLVDMLDIDFTRGLTTITGESGAGKSILLNALGLLLGERARTEVIRPGADKADVSAEFDVQELPAVHQMLLDAELAESSDTTCLVRRVVSHNGRSRGFVNGIPVTTAYLRELGEQLVDIHGQNEHLRLANRNHQLAMLDDYAGTQSAAKQVAELHQRWQLSLKQIESLQANLDAAADRKDLLTYQLSELEEFDLQPGEFVQLQQEHKRLSQAHQTISTLQAALENIDEMDSLRQSVRAVESIDDNQASLVAAQSTLQTVLGLLDDASRDLRNYADQVVVDPATLAEVEERLNLVQDLARKHRVTPDQLAEHANAMREELTHIDADRSALDDLLESAQTLETQFRKAAKTLSTKRKKAAPKFAKAVSQYMQMLGISKGAFTVEFENHVSESGIDRVEFQVTTNPNFPAGPLTQIASGGEQTRIALSIQIVAAEHSALPCLILDEADVGVGGTTADTVGRILRDLGRHTQVICVTHAPQVAALGNSHYRVVKKGDLTDIHSLDAAHRVEELARMLAGADITQKTREYAASLLKDATH